jgi:pimeloyl-ACP methyl ester carboxylesterase
VATTAPQRRQVTVRGLRLSFLEWGKPETARPSLMILHGLLAAGETFDRLVAEIGRGRHVIAVDMPANGHSEHTLDVDCSTASLAATVREFLDTVGLERPVLLGHSHGGLLALRLAVTEPQALRGLILLAPAHPYEGYRESMVRFYRRPFGRNAARYLFPRIPARMYLFFFRQMPGTRDHFDLEALEPYLHSLRMPGTVPYTLRVLDTWHEDMRQLREDLDATPLHLPTLVLWGEKDLVVPLSSATELLKHLPQARLVRLPMAGHLPNEEDPRGCAAAIEPWLEESFGASAVEISAG